MKKIVVVGSLNVDLVVNVKEMPLVGETILASDYDLIPGGKGANQAYAAGRLGAEVTMLGAVGKDENGDLLIQSLRHANVETKYIRQVENVKTGTALITVNSRGNNSIIVIPGANYEVDVDYIQAHTDVIRACDIVLMQLEIPIETVLYTAKLAKRLGKTVLLDPAPAQPDLPRELFSFVDILKPNELELCTLTGKAPDRMDLPTDTEAIKKLGAKSVLVTLGAQGAYLNDEAGKCRRFQTRQVSVVDSTAAGDSYSAAIAVALAEGKALSTAMEFADWVSTIVVTRKGAQSSIPSLEEVEQARQKSARL